MKISELIQKLQKQKELYGDLPVHYDREGLFDDPERVVPVYPRDKNYKEDKTQPPWRIELI